jgi:hypothetical protein
VIKAFPFPTDLTGDVGEYLRRLYAALVESQQMKEYEIFELKARITSTEPPDPRPGLFWVDTT